MMVAAIRQRGHDARGCFAVSYAWAHASQRLKSSASRHVEERGSRVHPRDSHHKPGPWRSGARSHCTRVSGLHRPQHSARNLIPRLHCRSTQARKRQGAAHAHEAGASHSSHWSELSRFLLELGSTSRTQHAQHEACHDERRGTNEPTKPIFLLPSLLYSRARRAGYIEPGFSRRRSQRSAALFTSVGGRLCLVTGLEPSATRVGLQRTAAGWTRTSGVLFSGGPSAARAVVLDDATTATTPHQARTAPTDVSALGLCCSASVERSARHQDERSDRR